MRRTRVRAGLWRASAWHRAGGSHLWFTATMPSCSAKVSANFRATRYLPCTGFLAAVALCAGTVCAACAPSPESSRVVDAVSFARYLARPARAHGSARVAHLAPHRARARSMCTCRAIFARPPPSPSPPGCVRCVLCANNNPVRGNVSLTIALTRKIRGLGARQHRSSHAL